MGEQVLLDLKYRDTVIAGAYRMDMVVERTIVVEVKAVERIAPVHRAQLASYLRLSDRRVGLLLNFNATTMKDGLVGVLAGQLEDTAP